MKLLSLLLITATLAFTSCKKDSTKPATPEPAKVFTPAQIEAMTKISGKWYIKKAIFTETKNGKVEVRTYINFDTTQFFNFKTDGKLEVSFIEKVGTLNYIITEDVKTFVTSSPNDAYLIKELTPTSLVLFKDHGAGVLIEEVFLSK